MGSFLTGETWPWQVIEHINRYHFPHKTMSAPFFKYLKSVKGLALSKVRAFEFFLLVALAIGLGSRTLAMDPANLILPRPPMGADLWYRFGADFNENNIRQTVDHAATNGLVELGWKYVMITDGWQGSRVNGKLTANSSKISNLTNLIAYIHGHGMCAGIYSEPTEFTAGGNVGSGGFIEVDAATFADWGIDYVQFDMGLVGTDGEKIAFANQFVTAIRKASARPIGVYTSGFKTVDPVALNILNCYRSTGDLGYPPGGTTLGASLWTNYLDHLDRTAANPEAIGPGHWAHPDWTPMVLPDADMAQIIFGMNAMIAAPLFAPDFYTRDEDPRHFLLYTNREIISIDQDPLGRQGQPVWQQGPAQVWSKLLADGSRAVALLNRSTNSTAVLTANWHDLGLFPGQAALVKNCWPPWNTFTTNGSFSAAIGRMHAEFFKIVPLKPNSTNWFEAIPNRDSINFKVGGQFLNACTVEISPDLTHWTEQSTITNTCGIIRFTDATSHGPGARFYRLNYR